MTSLLFRISSELNLSPYGLSELARTAWRRYKVFTIPKRTEGRRTIAQPSKALKEVQRWLVGNELKDLPLHNAAMAYREKRNIGLNAKAHSASNFLLKMDFANFFPSIHPEHLTNHIARYGRGRWSHADITLICSLVFWRPKGSPLLQLCIGGPASPFISNTVMYDFDLLVDKYCSDKGVTYTRYADDLAFSTREPNVLPEIEEAIFEFCKKLDYPQLVVNRGKTVHASRAVARKVTGLVLTPDHKVSIGRERKRMIRAGINRWNNGQLDAEEIEKIVGLLAFARDVEPDFVRRMAEYYGANSLQKLFALASKKRKQSSREKRLHRAVA